MSVKYRKKMQRKRISIFFTIINIIYCDSILIKPRSVVVWSPLWGEGTRLWMVEEVLLVLQLCIWLACMCFQVILWYLWFAILFLLLGHLLREFVCLVFMHLSVFCFNIWYEGYISGARVVLSVNWLGLWTGLQRFSVRQRPEFVALSLCQDQHWGPLSLLSWELGVFSIPAVLDGTTVMILYHYEGFCSSAISFQRLLILLLKIWY
jgi:hypothetical protein